MDNLIYELFRKISSGDTKISSNATTDLCCILEIKTWNLSKEDRVYKYSSILPTDLMEIEISERDEIEIIDFICAEILNNSKITSNLLFCIGQASCKVSLEPLLNIIERKIDGFNGNEVYQAFISLERILFFNESLSLKDAKKIISKTNLLEAMSKKILSLQVILHSGLEGTSLRLLARLIVLLNNSDF